MEALPVQYAITEDGLSIAFATLGQGLPVVFASNIQGDVSWYPVRESDVRASPRPIFDDLAACGWQVIAYDVRGFGASSRQLADFGVDGRRRDLEAVLGKLGVKACALGAGDSACATAIDYAVRNPGKIWALVLLDPWLSGERRFVSTQPARAMALVQPMADDEWDYFTLTLANVVGKYKDPARAHALAEFFRRTGSPEVFSAFRAAMRNTDVTSQATRLRDIPTLVVHQREFVFGSFELAQEVAQRISGARFIVVDGQDEEIRANCGVSQRTQAGAGAGG